MLGLLPVLLSLIVGLLGVLPVQAVTLPFSTTYNCAENNQDSGNWPNCGGLSAWGGWHAVAGSGEQITTSANNPGGGGGRGQRHWVSNDKNVNSGSLSVSFATQTEIYVRYYFRYQPGITMLFNSVPQKMIYFGNSIYCGLGPTIVRLTVNGTDFDNGGTWGYNDLMGGSTGDGQWHWTEWHLNLNTGVVQAWFDGVLRLNSSSVNYAGRSGDFVSFSFPENGQFGITPGIDLYQDVDDLAISTTGPIGALSGGGGGTLAIFLSQGLVVATTTIQYLFVLAFLWERRATVIKALIAVTLLKQYYWSMRYRRAVSCWQRNAPLMIEDRSHHPLEFPQSPQTLERERRPWQ